jgi:hypothetical protein
MAAIIGAIDLYSKNQGQNCQTVIQMKDLYFHRVFLKWYVLRYIQVVMV